MNGPVLREWPPGNRPSTGLSVPHLRWACHPLGVPPNVVKVRSGALVAPTCTPRARTVVGWRSRTCRTPGSARPAARQRPRTPSSSRESGPTRADQCTAHTAQQYSPLGILFYFPSLGGFYFIFLPFQFRGRGVKSNTATVLSRSMPLRKPTEKKETIELYSYPNLRFGGIGHAGAGFEWGQPGRVVAWVGLGPL